MKRKIIMFLISSSVLFYVILHFYIFLLEYERDNKRSTELDDFSAKKRLFDGCGHVHRNNSSPKLMYKGPGADGTAVAINGHLTSEEQKEIDMGYRKYGFNVFVSDLIPLDRRLDNVRQSQACLRQTYDAVLPDVSVIIPFRDEALSVLLRTVHSIYHNTPETCLKEIILVDDGSSGDFPLAKLRTHIHYLEKVKLIRLDSSQGLMRARQAGIQAVITDVIVVMDSHMEVVKGWFEPMAQELKENPKGLLTPKVGNIDKDSFAFQNYPFDLFPIDKIEVQTFDFYLYQTGSFMKEDYMRSRRSKISPFYVPAIQGNFFMMNRTFFMQLGGFDLGMKLWGAEQFELSFKTWMCGGNIKLIPCSLAAHIYREVKWSKPKSEQRYSNEYRLAAVWMDEFKKDVFEMLGNHSYEYGDIAERVRIRRKNKCQTFKFYLNKIKKFTHFYIPRGRLAKGAITNEATRACVDGTVSFGGETTVITYWCHSKGLKQYWEWSSRRQIRHGNVCLHTNTKAIISTVRCEEHGPLENTWSYTKNNEIIDDRSGLCLTAQETGLSLKLFKCTSAKNQKWHWTRLSSDP